MKSLSIFLIRILCFSLPFSFFSLVSLVPPLPQTFFYRVRPLSPQKLSSFWKNSQLHCDSWLSSSLSTIERQQQLKRERTSRATNGQKGFQWAIRGASLLIPSHSYLCSRCGSLLVFLLFLCEFLGIRFYPVD